MKKTIVLLLVALLGYTVAAQNYVPTQVELNRFYNSTTYVVLEKNPISSYNFKIQEAVKENWTITDYEFISLDQFEELRKDPKNSFLIMTQVVFEGDKTKARYDFLQLLQGKDVFLFEEMPELVSVPLAYTEVDEEYWVYKLETIVRFIENHMELIQKRPDLVDENIFSYYNENAKDVKKKTLYIVHDELESDVNTLSEIKDVYPYPVKIVDREDIEEAIKNRDPDVVFLHKVGPYGTRLRARCYKILIGANDANFYYFDYHNIIKGRRPDGFLKKDFKKIAKDR